MEELRKESGRTLGKSIKQLAQFISQVKLGKNPIIIGTDYIVMSRKSYDKLSKQPPTEETEIDYWNFMIQLQRDCPTNKLMNTYLLEQIFAHYKLIKREK